MQHNAQPNIFPGTKFWIGAIICQVQPMRKQLMLCQVQTWRTTDCILGIWILGWQKYKNVLVTLELVKSLGDGLPHVVTWHKTTWPIASLQSAHTIYTGYLQWSKQLIHLNYIKNQNSHLQKGFKFHDVVQTLLNWVLSSQINIFDNGIKLIYRVVYLQLR